ncbi:MAG: excinuclease ABC subunit UvrC [Acidobacteriota bacterium]
MPVGDLKAQIARLPEQPGVYLFYGATGDTLYVGKAAALRDRVRSYLGAWGTSPRIDALLAEAARLEVIVTDSVVEALALENNLIKQRQPRYNIRLRDDKNYPYLRLTVSETFPRLMVARRVERDRDVYAGPFMPASLARRTKSLTHRLFGLRSCTEDITGARPRPCLEYDIGRCVAPCVEAVCTAADYQRAVGRVRMLLSGQVDELAAQLDSEMRAAAAEERFEQAAHLRDAARTLRTLRDRQQKMATVRLGDRDAFGVKIGPSGSVIQVFQMRGGRVVERVDLVDDDAGTGPQPLDAQPDEAEVLQAALQQFYEDREIPPEIHVAVALPDANLLEEWLSARAGRRVEIAVPRHQARRGLIELATRNAAIAYQTRFSGGAVANYEALDMLRLILALPRFPRRIECFDVSTLQGTDTVASMVVCEDGRMKKGEYRKYRVRGDRQPDAAGRESPIPGPDDVAAMREAVFRRYRKVREAGGAMPDLILIDGGKGQVSAAYGSLERLGLADLVAIGLAKREELLVMRDRPDPLVLPTGHPSLLLLQRIRDEAHRFAVTFHRRARTTRRLRSELDLIPGIGPRRRRALLETFGSVAGVRRASREALTSVVGARAADAVLGHFIRSA